jgi:hypothetical protein
MDTAAKLEYNLLAIAMCRRPHAHFATGTAPVHVRSWRSEMTGFSPRTKYFARGVLLGPSFRVATIMEGYQQRIRMAGAEHLALRPQRLL